MLHFQDRRNMKVDPTIESKTQTAELSHRSVPSKQVQEAMISTWQDSNRAKDRVLFTRDNESTVNTYNEPSVAHSHFLNSPFNTGFTFN